MSGEGMIGSGLPGSITRVGSLAEICELNEQQSRPRFDRRPGELEATRGLTIVGVVGSHNEAGWEVRLQLGGGLSLRDMSIGGARRLAADILTLCDTLELGVPD